MADLREDTAAALPYLRRYARALTGSQQDGDHWVRLCVEVLLQQPDLLKSGGMTRPDVFTIFHKLRQPFRALEPSGPPEPRQRQVLLLTVLEAFTIDQAAGILGISVAEAEADLKLARDELKRFASVRVLVVEDKAAIVPDVAHVVRNAGHKVVGIAPTERAAIDLARRHDPHLILADIQLRDGYSGAASVRQILKSVAAPVIVVTGFPERLLTGEGLEPTFVITKPFDPSVLRTAMAHAVSSMQV